MALGAFDLFVEDMLCMVPGPADVRRVRELLVLFPVAAETECPRDDDLSVPRGDSPLAEERKAVHLDDLVLLGGMVAFMAVYTGMFAPRPLFVRLIMHMAGKTGIRVVLEIVVDLVGDE
jgi:hypothetical protein